MPAYRQPWYRFWTKVSVREDRDGCWPWKASRHPSGYGQFMWSANNRKTAHRLAYEYMIGPIPEGLVLDHLCNNPPCCNPWHLNPTTDRENILRAPNTAASVNARKTACPNGHPYSEENTRYRSSRYPNGRPSRRCRACDRKPWRTAHGLGPE